MKSRCLYLIALGLLLTACNEQNVPPSIGTNEQPILYGTLDTDEPEVVSLFVPDMRDTVYKICDPELVLYCALLYGDNYTCAANDKKNFCLEKCSEPAGTGFCRKSNGYVMTSHGICKAIEGGNVFIEDTNGANRLCAGGCNISHTDCDSSGTADYLECLEEDAEQCSPQRCLKSPRLLYCLPTCSSSGQTAKQCSEGHTHVFQCKNVNGIQMWAPLDESGYDCRSKCNDAGTDCDGFGPDLPPAEGTVPGDIYCTGTLIHPQWVLTAAHCVTDTESEIITESEDNEIAKVGIGYNENALIPYDTAGAEYFFYHPEYHSTDDFALNDIALIKLHKPIGSDVATPVPPLPKWLAFDPGVLPEMMVTSGFGVDENGVSGKKMNISIPTTHYCGTYNPESGESCDVGLVHIKGCHPNKEYCEKYGYYDATVPLSIPYHTIYAPYNDGGHCSGDSGGPTFYTVGGKRYVVGVTSYGDPPCRTFNVSTAVQDYYDWIISIAPEVAGQYKEICGNGYDDDGNDKIDCDDPACNCCGNAKLDNLENCDGSLFLNNKTKCSDWDSIYSAGNVTCTKSCEIDYGQCTVAANCGDHILGDDELCDGSVFKGNHTQCAQWDSKYSAGNVSCTSSCEIDYSKCTLAPYCGDNIVNNSESCDGSQMIDDKTQCADWDSKYSAGKVSCTKDCEIDYSKCTLAPYCGDSIVNDDESCDGSNFKGNKTKCIHWDSKYGAGNVSCTNDCEIDYSECVLAPYCGDNIVNNNESCDGSNFKGDKTKCIQWDSKYSAGTVSCTNDCRIDYSQCTLRPHCGDNVINNYEQCDGVAFAGNKTQCAQWDNKYSEGVVGCTKDCRIDFSQCVTTPYCGDNIVNGDEQCDGSAFEGNRNHCTQWDSKYNFGLVKCTKDCEIDFSQCELTPYCGDDIVNNGEPCDGNLFADDKIKCEQWGYKYSNGDVSCTKDCEIDYSNCYATIVHVDDPPGCTASPLKSRHTNRSVLWLAVIGAGAVLRRKKPAVRRQN